MFTNEKKIERNLHAFGQLSIQILDEDSNTDNQKEVYEHEGLDLGSYSFQYVDSSFSDLENTHALDLYWQNNFLCTTKKYSKYEQENDCEVDFTKGYDHSPKKKYFTKGYDEFQDYIFSSFD